MDRRIKQKGERIKAIAEIINKKEDGRVYIVDYDNNFYFADIVEIKSDSIIIDCFSPLQRKGERIELFYVNVKHIDSYKTNTRQEVRE